MKTIKWFFVVIVLIAFWQIIALNQNKITFVFDNEHDFTNQQIKKLDSLYKKNEDKTTNQFVLLTTNWYNGDSTISDFSLHFFKKHGIGRKNINNGILIVFSERYRQVQIETGYGTEKVLKNKACKKIIDSLMIPEFKKGRYFDGVWNGSMAIVSFLEKPENKIK